MKSPVFSELTRLGKLYKSLPADSRGRVYLVLKSKTIQAKNDFDKWEQQFQNSLIFLDCIVLNTYLLSKWKRQLFPRDAFDSAMIVTRAFKIITHAKRNKRIRPEQTRHFPGDHSSPRVS